MWFYRQSDVPEIPELTWLLTCVAGKGILNRAHAYKAAVDRNRAEGVVSSTFPLSYGGSLIEDTSDRREAFNIMLSMPRGTDPSSVQWAAREFAKAELADHKYVMVLHDHQANPHVHISVRAESRLGRRLNPRKTDLHRWRETFAAKLRERHPGLEVLAELNAIGKEIAARSGPITVEEILTWRDEGRR